MKKIAVLLAEGFEEGEALWIVDVFRRANLACDTYSLKDPLVKGSHDIIVSADKLLDDSIADYDMIFLPGGLPGATNLRDDQRVLAWVRYFDGHPEKYVAAMCAAPMVLKAAGITTGRTLTSYPGDKYRDLFKDAHYVEDLVVVDGHLLTSRGPATTLPFAFRIIDVLGGDSQIVKERMLYPLLAQDFQ